MNKYVFTEKYRPTTYDDVIGMPVELRTLLDDLQPKTCILLTGTPGTGKTTTSKILVKQNQQNAITLNASDERGIDVVRSRIKNFALNMSVDGGIKIINLEEFDEMTSNAQNALRNLMEEVPNCIWILTGNYENKIVDAIKNRCFHFKFKQPKVEDIISRLQMISNKEEIKLTPTMLEQLVKVYYPSIRSMVKELQRLKGLDREITLADISNDNEEIQQLYNNFKEHKFIQTRQLAIDSGVDYSTILLALHDKLLWDEQVNPTAKLETIKLLGDSLRYLGQVPSQEIEFESFLAKCREIEYK